MLQSQHLQILILRKHEEVFVDNELFRILSNGLAALLVDDIHDCEHDRWAKDCSEVVEYERRKGHSQLRLWAIAIAYVVEEETQYDDATDIDSILPKGEEVQAHQTLVYYDLVGFQHLTELLDPYQWKSQDHHDY